MPGEAAAAEKLENYYKNFTAEGDAHMRRRDWLAAVESYTKALGLKPGGKIVTLARARCNVEAGLFDLAIKDAEKTLADDPEFFRGLLVKADALFACGEFEFAMVNYHRGAAARPDVPDFRLGIQKSQIAIETSFASTKYAKDLMQAQTDVKDHLKATATPSLDAELGLSDDGGAGGGQSGGPLSVVEDSLDQFADGAGPDGGGSPGSPGVHDDIAMTARKFYSHTAPQSHMDRPLGNVVHDILDQVKENPAKAKELLRVRPVKTSSRKLLGALNADKQFLVELGENMRKDEIKRQETLLGGQGTGGGAGGAGGAGTGDNVAPGQGGGGGGGGRGGRGGVEVQNVVADGLTFLGKRRDFWRQQSPYTVEDDFQHPKGTAETMARVMRKAELDKQAAAAGAQTDRGHYRRPGSAAGQRGGGGGDGITPRPPSSRPTSARGGGAGSHRSNVATGTHNKPSIKLVDDRRHRSGEEAEEDGDRNSTSRQRGDANKNAGRPLSGKNRSGPGTGQAGSMTQRGSTAPAGSSKGGRAGSRANVIRPQGVAGAIGGAAVVKAKAAPMLDVYRAKPVAAADRRRYLDQSRYAVQTLENVRTAMVNCDYSLALQFCKAFIARLHSLELSDKPRLFAACYSNMGECYWNLNSPGQAISHHKKDLEIGIRNDVKEAYIRALRHLGNCYERMREYDKAIVVLTKRINFASSDEEASVNEALARCYLEKHDNTAALTHAQACLHISATRDMDAVQEMKGTFMVGLSLYRLDRHHDAIAMFERYLDLSRALNDKSAEATAMTHLGNAHLQLGEVHKSIHLQQQALQLLASVGPVH